MTAYYNEFDPVAAQWLRNLIAAGHIAPGEVDERSISDVRPSDLRGFTQCHFFAGIGVWSLALRRAGWPDDRPIWTGSCPCQPFSSAGKVEGFADERHLWPDFYWLIRQCRPGVVVGEQVASKAAGVWLDAVQADLEALGYAFGALAFPSAGVGAPHIRDRTFWVGHTDHQGLEGHPRHVNGTGGSRRWTPGSVGTSGGNSGLANASGEQFTREVQEQRERSGEMCQGGQDRGRMHFGRLANDPCDGRGEERSLPRGEPSGDRAKGQSPGPGASGSDSGAGPTNGFWRDADWLFCRDGKWRPVEPGTFPLAHGAPARVGRLRAYGNAINAEAATVFVEAYLDVEAERAGRADLSECAFCDHWFDQELLGRYGCPNCEGEGLDDELI